MQKGAKKQGRLLCGETALFLYLGSKKAQTLLPVLLGYAKFS